MCNVLYVNKSLSVDSNLRIQDQTDQTLNIKPLSLIIVNNLELDKGE